MRPAYRPFVRRRRTPGLVIVGMLALSALTTSQAVIPAKSAPVVIDVASLEASAPDAPGTPMPAATPLANGVVLEALMQSSYSAEGIAFDLLLAPPVFYESIRRPDQAVKVGADVFVVFLIAEHHYHEDTSHSGHFALMPILKLDGRSIHVASETIEISNDGHHRTTALVFPELPVSLVDEVHTWEMILPPDANGQRAVLTWYTPIEFPEAGSDPV